MNFLLLSLIMIAIGGGVFHVSGSELLTSNASAMLSIVSIMAAAVLVRLNRGIPAVDWKSVEKTDLDNLLNGIEEIAKAYVVTFGTAIIAIGVVISELATNAGHVLIKGAILTVLADLFGILFGLLLSRMIYIVWLDLDIIRLQRIVIASAASSLDTEKQSILAKKKMAEMDKVKVTVL